MLPFQVNYEADFLLKNRDKTRSYKKAFEASRFEEKAVIISLLSDVATVIQTFLSTMRLSAIRKKSQKTINKYSITTTKNLQEA